MNDKINFETFLLFSPKKIIIAVYDKKNFEKIFYKETFNKNNLNELDLDFLKKFLDQNIFEIEKYLKNFIEKINLILESDKFLTINISIKKNNYNSTITKDKLKPALYEIKEECKKTVGDRKIIHMVINNYLIDNEKYSSLPQDLKCEFFSLDVKFECMSNKLIKDIEKTFREYQVSIGSILNFNYVKSFLNNDQSDLFKMSMEVINGYDQNEVVIVQKKSSNTGFFERFFNFFN